jgi:glycosyltransferase involved in cell wall biosynthesis
MRMREKSMRGTLHIMKQDILRFYCRGSRSRAMIAIGLVGIYLNQTELFIMSVNSPTRGTMKVLYMCEWPGHGIHSVWLQYARGLKEAGAYVYLATSGQEYDPGTLQEARDYGLDLVELPEFFDRRNGFRNAGQALAGWLSENSVDLIHCQGYRELYDVARACRRNRQRQHIVMADRNPCRWAGCGAIKRVALMLRERPWIITLSQAHYKKIRRIPRMARRTTFIPNAVDTRLFPYAERPSDCAGRPMRLIYPARMEDYKGHGVFLDFFKEAAPLRKRCELVLAGGGSLEEDIRSKIKSLGLTDCVKMLGRVPWKELPGLYARCDIGVFPTSSEMMPKAVLEMMATGLPVVAHDVGAMRDIIDHGRTGFITAVGDKRLFRSYLEHLIDNPQAGRAIGKAASAEMRGHFSIEAISKQTVALYESMCMDGSRA